MASTKRSFDDFLNKKEFNFYIENGIIKFPKLYSKCNNNEKIRVWEIYAIMYNNDKKTIMSNKIINKENFEIYSQNKKLYIHIITEYGLIDGVITKTEPTKITYGKNIGKKNETTIITQSLIHMRNLYLKKIKAGYYNSFQEENTNLYPMALHLYNKNKHKIKYPCYIQPKLDGIRITAKYENNEVQLLSRRLNSIFGFDEIKQELKTIFRIIPDIIIDGEFYNHFMNLQQISGIVRHQNEHSEDKLSIKYYVFDCFTDKNNKFENRISVLNSLYNIDFKFIVLTPTILVNTEEEGDYYYKRFVDDGYEGAVYKNKDAFYESSTIKEKRSYNFLKRKKHYDAEYKIVDFEQGRNGKDKGAIIFTMETENGKTFKAVPNMSLNERKKIFIHAQNNFEMYKNKMATISFDEYSNDNVPLRAKFISIREDF